MSRPSVSPEADREQSWRARYVLAPSIEMQALWGSEVIVANVGTGAAFKLNPSAADIVGQLKNRVELGEVVAALLERYSVDRTTLEQDVRAIVTELLSKGIIVGSGADR